jgi:Zn-dependent peptidase ImmA (M78 family)
MDSLLKIAADLKATIIYLPLGRVKKGLFGLHIPETKTIFMDTKLLEPEYYKLHRCILAEELGHVITGTSVNALKIHTNYSLKRKISEEEEKALQWATEKLIPTDELSSLLEQGFFSCEELSDYFGVTVWFMFRKLEFMQVYCEGFNNKIRPFIKKAKISCF